MRSIFSSSPVCPYCFPFSCRRPTKIDRVTDLLHTGMERIVRTCVSSDRLQKFDQIFWNLWIQLLLKLRFATFETDPEPSHFFNRSLIFVREAKARGLDVRALRAFGRYNGDFRWFINGTHYDYNEIPLTLCSKDITAYDRKQALKDLLREHRLPHAEGACFTDSDKAYAYGAQLGFPLIVKPNHGSLTVHTTFPIHDRAALREAIRIGQLFEPEVIVERFVTGTLYRATVIGREHVFVCERQTAHVIGDGLSTIATLVASKNAHPKRKPAQVKNTTSHLIPVGDVLEGFLSEQGLTLESVPEAHAKVLLSKKCTLATGSDLISRTTDAHPENKNLFLQLAHILETDLVGMDFIIPSIGQSYRETTAAILEINTLPYVDLHEEPLYGPPDPVAKIGWDVVCQRLGVTTP